ncbi:MAG: 3-phosphoshikimate 1-carboxyvinyltransferase [bacterium]
MKKFIHTSVIDGEIQAPSSKSYTIRAFAGALLSDGHSIILNPSICEDTKSALAIIEELGAEVEHSKNSIRIKGRLNKKKHILDSGESALCLRLFSALAPLFSIDITITGQGSLLKRNFTDVEQSLKAAGINCESNDGFLPIKINGKYGKSEIDIDSSRSSQFLSGLLFALPILDFNTTINVSTLQSKPYINLTLEILKQFGIKINHTDFKEFNISGNQKYNSTNIIVEGDWSNSSFLLVAGAISGNVKIKGLNINSLQGDRNILQIIDRAGAFITINEDNIEIKKGVLRSFNYNASDTPDLFPPLVSLATACEGISKIVGTDRLLNKESNRLKTLISEFSKLGINIFEQDNTLFVEGGNIRGAEVDSHHDHRIAMALAVAGLTSDKPVIINNAECVSKSYHDFYKDLKIIGGKIDE